MRKNWLVIFVKAPAAGRVKTRLARGIGTVPAAWWFRHQVSRLMRNVGRDQRWHTVLAVAPDREVMSRALPGGWARIAQGSGDLGARMGRVLRGMPPGPVVIVGTDVPGIRAHHVAEAFRVLGGRDAVMGPAPDGGYWLIGLHRGGQAVPAGLFHGVRWSTRHAMADTLESLRPLRVGKVVQLADVDEAKDLSTGEIRAERN